MASIHGQPERTSDVPRPPTVERLEPRCLLSGTTPIDAVASGPYATNLGQSVQLDASASTHANGYPLEFAWDLDNDGAFDDATGATPLVDFATLQDLDLNSGDNTIAVRVAEDAPPGELLDVFVDFNFFGNNFTDMVFGPDGDLYAVNFLDDSVRRFDGDTGAFVEVFVTYSPFNTAHNLAFGPDGNLYVTNSGQEPGFVARFDGTTGAFIDTFIPVGPGGVERPIGMAFGPDGMLYINEDFDNVIGADDVVKRFDTTTGAYIDDFASIPDATAIRFGPDNHLYATINDRIYGIDRVEKYDIATGALIQTYLLGVSEPSDLAFGPDGDIYISDSFFDTVLRLDPITGNVATFISAGAGGLEAPDVLLFRDDGKLYVESFGDEHVLRFNGPTFFDDSDVATLTITAPSIDLVGQSLSLAPGPGLWGQDFTADWVVRNDGAAAANPFSIGFYLSQNAVFDAGDILLDREAIAVSIPAAGVEVGSIALSTPGLADLPAGWPTTADHFVLMVVDDLHDNVETDEDNNSALGDGIDTVGVSMRLDDPYEVNNARVDAYDLGAASMVRLGDLLGVGYQFDDDWYRIDTGTDSAVLIEATFAQALGNVDIALYNAAGVLITSATSLTDNEVIDIDGLTPGEHFIRVFGSGDTNSYDLLVVGYDPSSPGVAVTPIDSETDESGDTALFTVDLDSRPTADVVIPIASGDTTEGTVSTASLTFTPDNWYIAQTVTVTGADDTLIDSDAPYTVALSPATSTDVNYGGLDPVDVAMTNLDDESPGTTYLVTTLADSLANDGQLSLREAVLAANSDTAFNDAPAGNGWDLILFDPALFAGGPQTLALAGVELAITDDLTIVGPGMDDLTIDALDLSRVFNIDDGTGSTINVLVRDLSMTRGATSNSGGAIRTLESVLIERITITASNAEASEGLILTPPTWPGGTAIQNVGGALEVYDSVITGNGLDDASAAIVSTTNSTAKIVRTDISDNRGRGITVYNNTVLDVIDSTIERNFDSGSTLSPTGIRATDSTVNISGTTIADHVGGNEGGGIWASRVELNIADSIITGNTAKQRGGGIFLEVGGGSITDSTVGNNRIVASPWFGGGGLYLYTTTGFSITRSTFTENALEGIGSNAGGGGVYHRNGVLVIDSSTFSQNVTGKSSTSPSASSGHGGAIFAEDDLVITNSTFSGNDAHGQGGALYLVNTFGNDWQVRFSTIVDNTADTGGGIRAASGNLILTNTIVANNVAASNFNDMSALAGGDNNLVEDPVGALLTGADNIVGIDPALGPLADNGGPTQTHLPQPGSPVIDAGVSIGSPVNDQRGVIRPQDGDGVTEASGEYDIGAVEIDAAPTVAAVLVSSRSWTDNDFLNAIDPFRALGYEIPVGDGSQLTPLPWTDLDQIHVVFSEDVTVTQDDLIVNGVNIAKNHITGFTYNAATFTATWTLDQSIPVDKVLVDVQDTAKDAWGSVLDGEWQNPADPSDLSSDTYTSGDGAAGGDFEFRFNVVPGDTNQDGSVTGVDLDPLLAGLGLSVGDAGYSVFADIDGSGDITSADIDAAKLSQRQSLPTVEPIPTDGVSPPFEPVDPTPADKPWKKGHRWWKPARAWSRSVPLHRVWWAWQQREASDEADRSERSKHSKQAIRHVIDAARRELSDLRFRR